MGNIRLTKITIEIIIKKRIKGIYRIDIINGTVIMTLQPGCTVRTTDIEIIGEQGIRGEIANLTLHRENLDIDKLWESTSQTNESSLTKKERWMELILRKKEDVTASRHALQNDRTLKEIIREAKNLEEKETNQDDLRITYLAVGISTPLLS
jgi:hypothetical protein